ncbi:LuxR C-terminal-related transcriptional regulator [Streptomyces sp. NBC_01142]|uniref:ATP-binding protein n=1 Tax=Streptomyces sp. NBC_01142 TaxID=2975865 RepID=UPI0022513854|nr:LuxR C-terminal-related transcriptional regulator [Streptomyces sp. NBC_01142]MCX4825705.1 LuxR C-terminal-related transcriptional regulator [Streptomyces sp. NBC_01142]
MPASDRGPELPNALDTFVGRRRELTELRTVARSARLLTLTGPGGVGKTRLALQFAAGLRDAGDGRTRLIELDSLHDGAQLAQTVAGALGIGERGERSGIDVLADALAENRTTVILDNCEHLAEPCARLVADLLSRCPRLRILATSREKLRVPGEIVFRVGELSLTPTDTVEDPAAALQSDAVRLFVERATECAPDFALHAGNATTVAQICRRLDGMPLAIELAARRTSVLPLGAILAGLDDQLSLLTDGSRTGPGRHRELAAAIDWSHRLLDPQERTLFRRLSVLVGSFDSAGAAAVCSDDAIPPRRVLRLLCALEAKSLIVRAPAAQPEDIPRFRLLNTMRAYALERLDQSGESDATWQRALEWLTGLAQAHADQVFPDQRGGRPAEERENLAAAIAHTDRNDGATPPLLKLALARVRYQQEQLTAARALLSDALAEDSGSRCRGSALALAARAACQQADQEAALRFADKAVAVERRHAEPARLANALDARAAALVCNRRFAQAVTDFAECLAIVSTLDNPQDTAWCTHHLAWALLHVGETAEGDALMSSCLPELRAHAPWCQVAAALHTAGAIRLATGDLQAAEALFGEGLRAVPGESFHALYPLEGLAVVAVERGEIKRSVRLFAAGGQARRRMDTEPENAWRMQVEEASARAEAALTPAARDQAVAQGRRLDWERLVAYALRGPVDTAADPDHARGPLTGREAAVAALVADGLTNREIGTRLGLSASTVATHLDNVRDKLGMRSRTRIALWVAANAPE